MTLPMLRVRDRARFTLPTTTAFTIDRPDLNELYLESRGRIVRVLAPGGYGKSTLVARWMSREDRPVLWFDVENIDNDAARFADALISALAALDPAPFAAMPLAAIETHWFTERVVPAIGHAVAQLDAAFVLVIDDVHEIQDPIAGAILDAIAANLPDDSTLVLSGRSHPVDGSIARFRLEPGVVDIDASMLALTDEQSRRLLRELGVSDEHAGHFPLEQFAGWPAGLQLAGLVLETDGATDQVDSITQATVIADYLRSEWTRSLRVEDLQFLREVACLGRFTARMCFDVLDRTGAAETLRRLERKQQLVLPLDRRGRWYRMHPILAEWLEDELRDADPVRWTAVHLRTADWWEQHGDIDLAFDHAVAVDALDRCEELVVVNAAVHFPMGTHAIVRGWLQRLPDDRIRGSAQLSALATMSALHLGDGRRAKRWYDNLTHLIGTASAAPDQDNPHQDDETASIAEALGATIDVRPVGELAESAARARSKLRPGPWRTDMYYVEGAHRFMRGEDRCIELWEEGALDAEVENAPLLIAHCLAASAVARDLGGDSTNALARGRRAQTVLRATNATLFPQMALVVATSAWVEARDGHTDLAVAEMSIACRHIESFRSVTPWFNTLTRFALIRTALLLGDRQASTTLLREAEQHARVPGDAAGALRVVESLREQIDVASAMPFGGASALTPAERRVLVYLPTNLSLSDIATHLYVSRNTVKTHAASIYRKFGTTSRGEAVELARRAGLLDENDAASPS